MDVDSQTFRSSLSEPSAGTSLPTDEEIVSFIEHSESSQPHSVAVEHDGRPGISAPNENPQSATRLTQVSEDEEILAHVTPPNLSDKKSASEGNPSTKALLMSWVLEFIFLILGLLCFTAIVTVLLNMRGQRQPHWPYTINLSTLIAILATVLRSMLMQVVEQGT